MNLNEFVVLPNKSKYDKFNGRNLSELRLGTATLAQQSTEMEERLQQLKERMAKEKQERGGLGSFRWKSGQSGQNKLSSGKRNKDKGPQRQLSGGKMKLRLLKDDPLSAPPPPIPHSADLQDYRKCRLRGKTCGQCEVKSAGLMCTECGEDYCVGCFVKFHQKGALKLHRMVPIQTELHTNVSSLNVVGRFQNQVNPTSCSDLPTDPTTFPIANIGSISSTNPIPSPTSQFKRIAVPVCRVTDPQIPGIREEQELQKRRQRQNAEQSQVLVVHHEGCGERAVMAAEEGEEKTEGFASCLLHGEYSEEDSSRSFQEAVREWRGGSTVGRESRPLVWRPADARPASVSAMGTQAGLPVDGGAVEGGEGGRVPVKVEFTENGLSYLDRLLLKRHRRTAIETYRPPPGPVCPPTPPTHACAEEIDDSLTGEIEDFHLYCASLFAVPGSHGDAKSHCATPGSCRIREVLYESVTGSTGASVGIQSTGNSTNLPSFQRLSNKGALSEAQPDITIAGSPTLKQPSLHPQKTSGDPRAVAHPKGRPQASLSESNKKSSVSSKSKPVARRAIKTPTTKSQMSSPTLSLQTLRANQGSPQHPSSASSLRSHPESPKPLVLPPARCVSPPCPALGGPLNQERHPSPPLSRSISLRSTFTLSTSSSAHLTTLPKVSPLPTPAVWESPQLPTQPRLPSSACQQLPNATGKSTLISTRESPSECSRDDPEPTLSHKHCYSAGEEPAVSPVLAQASIFSPLACPKQSSCPNSPEPLMKSSSPSTVMRSFVLPLEPLATSSLVFSDVAVYDSRMATPPLHLANPSPSGSLCSRTPLLEDSHKTSHRTTHSLSSVRMEEEPPVFTMGVADDISINSLCLNPDDGDPDEDWKFKNMEEHSEPENMGKEEMTFLSEVQLASARTAGCGAPKLVGWPCLSARCGSASPPGRTQPSPTLDDAPTAGSGSWAPSSSFSTSDEGHLVVTAMKDNHSQPTGSYSGSTTVTSRGDARGLDASGGPTLALSRPGSAPHRAPSSGTLMSRPGSAVSLAAREILDICGVDQAGCEDPDLEPDTESRTLSGLEEDIRTQDAMEAWTLARLTSGKRSPQGCTGGRVSEEQKLDEEEKQQDHQSVLALP